MKLRDYLHFNRLTARKFADILGISHNHLRAVNRGQFSPSVELAQKIEIMTGGQVTVAEMRTKEGT